MNQEICQKCGAEISNQFGISLAYCTNCGASIRNLHAENLSSLEGAPTLLSPKTTNYNSPSNSKTTRNVLGCLGLGLGAILLAAIGIFAYWYWSGRNYADWQNKGKNAPPNSQVVRFLSFEAESLDPHSRHEATITNALFDGLAEYNNQNADLTPSLATKWERNADATVWTFYLRKDARWTDGNPITASDFVYSWRRVLNPDFKSSAYSTFLLYDIKNAELYNTKKAAAEEVGVRAIDDSTLQVTLEKPTPFFDKLIALTVFRPVPRQAIEKFGENWTKPENIVSSGAFKLIEWTPKDQTVVERNPKFWDAAKTKLEKVIFVSSEKISPSSQTPEKYSIRFEKGEIDAAQMSATNEVSKDKEHYSIIKSDGIEFLNLNTTVKPFSDARVRRAFSLAIDREKLKEKDISNFPTASFVPEIKGYENAKGNGYNPNEARRLLSEAGFPQGLNFPEVEYIYNTNERNRNVAQFVQEQLQKELGVKIKLVNIEFRDYLKKRTALQYNGIARGGWIADYSDPSNFLDIFSAEKNESGWNDKKFVEMMTKARAETDEAKRYKMLGEAENYLLDEQPVIPLFITGRGFLCRAYIKNLSFNSLGQINWREVYIDPNAAAK
jgi:oligopeptide transport system substrate-binding protein